MSYNIMSKLLALTVVSVMITSTMGVCLPLAGAATTSDFDAGEYEYYDDYEGSKGYTIVESPNFGSRTEPKENLLAYMGSFIEDNDITGDGSISDPYLCKDIRFVGTFNFYMVKSWKFVHCVFDSRPVLNEFRNFNPDTESTDLIEFRDCLFYVSDYSRQSVTVDPHCKEFIFCNNTMRSFDPYTGTASKNPTSSYSLIVEGVEERFLVDNNTLDVSIYMNGQAVAEVRNNVFTNPYRNNIDCGSLLSGSNISNNEDIGTLDLSIGYGVSGRVFVSNNSATSLDIWTPSGQASGGSVHVYDNHLTDVTQYGTNYLKMAGSYPLFFDRNIIENSKTGYVQKLSDGVVLGSFNDNQFIDSFWYSYEKYGLKTHYEDAVRESEVPVNWSFFPILIDVPFAGSAISLDGGNTWQDTDGPDRTVMSLGSDEIVHQYLLRVMDANNNAFIKHIGIAYDISAPEIEFLAPVEGKTLRTDALQVLYNANDFTGVKRVEMRLDGGEPITGVNVSGHVFEGAAPGAHTLTLYVEDMPGNNKTYTVNFAFRPMGNSDVYRCVEIDGNVELSNYAKFLGLSGSGTKADPYVLKGLNLDCQGGTGIKISDTDLHFIIYDVQFINGRIGVHIENASNVTVMDCLFNEVSDKGVVIAGHGTSSVIGSYFQNIAEAIVLDSDGAVVEGNIAIGSHAFLTISGEGSKNLIVSSNEIVDCDTGICAAGLNGTLNISDNTFANIHGPAIDITALAESAAHAALRVENNDISLSETGVRVMGHIDVFDVIGNSVFYCGAPFTHDGMPNDFSGNRFFLNEECSELKFTSPGPGTSVKYESVLCEYAGTDIGGAPFVNFEASLDAKDWAVAEDGAHQYELKLEGENTIFLQGTDADGNVYTVSLVIVRDTKAPLVKIILPQKDLTMVASELSFSWTIQDLSEIKTIKVALDNGEWKDADSSTGHTFKDLGPGRHTVKIKVTDVLDWESEASDSFRVLRPGSSFISGPLIIDGDEHLMQTAKLLGWGGDGSESDPFIAGPCSDGLTINGTSLHLVFRDMNDLEERLDNITLTNISNVTFSNVNIGNGASDWGRFTIDGFSNIVIENCNMTRLYLNQNRGTSLGIISNGEGLVFTGNDVRNINGSRDMGVVNKILLQFRNVNDLTISENSFSKLNAATPLQLDIKALDIASCSRVVVIDNDFLECTGGAVKVYECDDVDISHNVIQDCDYRRNKNSGGFSSIDVGGNSVSVHNNTIVNSRIAGPGIIFSGEGAVRDNKIVKTQINIFEGQILIKSNTFEEVSESAIYGNAAVIGNKIVSATYGISPTAGAVIDGNDLDNCDYALCPVVLKSGKATTFGAFPDNVVVKNNVVDGKAGLHVGVSGTATNLMMENNRFNCTGPCMSLTNVKFVSSTFKDNTFRGVVGDSLISFEPVTGTVTQNTLIKVNIGSSILGTTLKDLRISPDLERWRTVSAGGVFTLDPLLFEDGDTDLYCRILDQSGNSFTTSLSFVYDARAPLIEIVSPTMDVIVVQSTVTVTWNVEDISQIALERVNIDGRWETVSSPGRFVLSDLADGMHTIMVEVTDETGHNATVSMSFIVDTTAPSLSIRTPVDGLITSENEVRIIFTADDGATSIVKREIRIGGTWQTIDTDEYLLTGLSEGTHVIAVRVTDATNRMTEREVTFVVDRTAPELTIASPTGGSRIVSNDVSLTFEAGDAALVTISVDGGIWKTISNEPYALELDDGTHTIALRAFDAAGNMNETSVTFVVDTSAPVVTLISPGAGTTVSKADTDVFFAVSDASTVSSLTLSVDGAAAVHVMNVRTWHLADLSDGTHTLVFRAVDELGNEASYSFSITVSVPVTVSGRILDGNGNPLAGAKVTVGTVSTTTDDNGRYTLQTTRGAKNMIVTAEGMSEMRQSLDLSSEMSSVSMSMKSSSDGADAPDNTGLIVGAVVVIAAAMLAIGMLVLRKKGRL